ncbi:Response regulator receiver domain-containing protein [Paenibacillus algorifonticola]|uniref:Response regulator receiver domain-containing protein n=1 Tax=Paenibacillus algorifonticola TaxID=684063 RepID=A0A1I2GSS9_9BACL|nr:helix-turn-helix domain-containing protein [Paenibacillus algorifonticola]SFF20685.1 Response regulator receiver domain-containing protein [Paenibacillus algorifonticola]
MYKVFLVDDEELVIKSLIASVDWGAYGFEITGYALSGSEAFDAIQAIEPHLVFTDIRMPGISGLELIKQLKDTSSRALVIVLSGYAEFALAQKAINYGAFGYCLKPFDEIEISGFLKNAAKLIKDKEMTKDVNIFEYLETGSPEYAEQLKKMLLAAGIIQKSEEVDRNFTAGLCFSPPVCDGTMSSKSRPGAQQVRNRSFKGILQYVDEHYREDLTISFLSEHFNVNANYISQLFRKEMGTTFTQYITALRMDYACRLLSETDLPINEVAEQSGYSDYFYFTRIFKRAKGTTPSSYRASTLY